MTPAQFRRIALSMPDAVEEGHMGHPDFRIQGKIFATLITRGGAEWGMVKLTPEQQRQTVLKHPAMFESVPGGWGRRGATYVRLARAERQALRDTLFTAWLNHAPKRLIEKLDGATEKPSARTPKRRPTSRA